MSIQPLHFIHRMGSSGRRITIAWSYVEPSDSNLAQVHVRYGAVIWRQAIGKNETFRKATNRLHATYRWATNPVICEVNPLLTRTVNAGQSDEATVLVSIPRQIRRAMTELGVQGKKDGQVFARIQDRAEDITEEVDAVPTKSLLKKSSKSNRFKNDESRERFYIESAERQANAIQDASKKKSTSGFFRWLVGTADR